MWSILQQQSFVVGAALILVYQAAKFGQLNLADPVTGRYVALLSGVKVRDLAGPYAYHAALAAFLGVSLVAYFLFCNVSPSVLTGVGRIFGNKDAAAILKDVPYPLYVAALFMGLTQPIIPGLSQLGDAQKNFFMTVSMFHGELSMSRSI